MEEQTKGKLCRSCKEFKEFAFFSKNSKRSDGLQTQCKECAKKYRIDNKDRLAAQAKIRYDENREAILTQKVVYYEGHKEEIAAKGLEYREANRPLLCAKSKSYREENPDKVKETNRRYYDENKEEILADAAVYYLTNKSKIIARSVAYEKRKMAEDAGFRLIKILRQRLRSALKKGTKGGSVIDNLGCSIEELRLYIEGLFQADMTWDNWGSGKGKWHLDHILPLSIFDLSRWQHVAVVCHYTNLQPLWSEDNLRKGKRILYPFKNLRSSEEHG